MPQKDANSLKFQAEQSDTRVREPPILKSAWVLACVQPQHYHLKSLWKFQVEYSNTRVRDPPILEVSLGS